MPDDNTVSTDRPQRRGRHDQVDGRHGHHRVRQVPATSTAPAPSAWRSGRTGSSSTRLRCRQISRRRTTSWSASMPCSSSGATATTPASTRSTCSGLSRTVSRDQARRLDVCSSRLTTSASRSRRSLGIPSVSSGDIDDIETRLFRTAHTSVPTSVSDRAFARLCLIQ